MISEDLKNALTLADVSQLDHIAKPRLTCDRALTSRGVLWLGQTCNLCCQFCYFIDRVSSKEHPEHAFMSLEKAKKICRTLVDFYGNTAVDIQGGEPTIFPGILDLISYCRDIGLTPTLITNALALENPELCRQYQQAGVRDFLISVQGLGDVHDQMVGVPGAHKKQMVAIRNLRNLGIPFRFNSVMSKGATIQLPEIAELAVKTGARVVNFITFNPFADQAGEGQRSTENVPRYSEVKDPLQLALGILEDAGLEGNVRYFPLCILDGAYRKNIYGFQQLPYDQNEWDYASWGWTGLAPQRTRNDDLSPPLPLTASRLITSQKGVFKRLADCGLLRPLLYSGHKVVGSLLTKKDRNKEELYRKVARIHADIHCKYHYGKACKECDLKKICDGFHLDYVKMFGMDEAQTVQSAVVVEDSKHFILKQSKVYCPDGYRR